MQDAALYYMPFFKSGAFVQWQGNRETVSHVVLRRFAMMVYLVGHEEPVDPEKLSMAPSAFCMTRMEGRQ